MTPPHGHTYLTLCACPLSACPPCGCPVHPWEIVWRQGNHGRCGALGCRSLRRLHHKCRGIDHRTFRDILGCQGARRCAGESNTVCLLHRASCLPPLLVALRVYVCPRSTSSSSIGRGVVRNRFRSEGGQQEEQGFVLMWRRIWAVNRADTTLHWARLYIVT